MSTGPDTTPDRAPLPTANHPPAGAGAPPEGEGASDDEDEDPAEALDAFDQELFDRERRLRLLTAELNVKEGEDKLHAKEQQRLKEARDEREAILKAVRVSTPDLSRKLVEKMDEMSIDKHSFVKRADTTLFDTTGVKLSAPQEFFDLSPAQREDLLDRVGFYRGIIVDHGQTNVIQPSFLDVLERQSVILPPATGFGSDLSPIPAPAPPAADAPRPETTVARALYRKSNYAGFFENSFTSSEAVHQSQKNGVTNLKFSLAVAGGVATKVGVGVGVGYNEQSQVNDGGVRKKVYITSNFYLPKIELSFDSRTVCASKAFIQAVREALAAGKDTDSRFAALKGALDIFGHFASTSTLVGGRLFATETRDYVGAETGSDVTKRFAAELKGMISTPGVTAEMSASAERSTQEIRKDKSTDEQQAMTFHAVGGEGGVVKDASAWITSLFDYRRWSAVQRENLIPSINLLPADLSKACWDVLEAYAKARTKRALLFDEDAYFLFYGAYGERAGKLASETWFIARSPVFASALTVSDARPGDGSPVSLQAVGPLEGQIWRMTPDGHLVSRARRPAAAYGKREDVEFAVTVVGALPAATAKNQSASVQMRQLGRAPHQTWRYEGAGQFVNASFGADFVLSADGINQVVVRPRSVAADAGQIWDLIEVSGAAAAGGAVTTATGATARRVGVTPDPGLWFKLRSTDTRTVLSARNGVGRAGFARGEKVLAVMAPDIDDYHQLWRMTDDGRIINRLQQLDGAQAEDIMLSLGAEDAPLTVAPDASNLRQRWSVTTEGYLAPIGARTQSVATAGTIDALKLQGSPLTLQPRTSVRRQIWSVESVGLDPLRPPLTLLSTTEAPESGDGRLFMVDGRELKINGQIVGLGFRWFERSFAPGKTLQLEVTVRRTDGAVELLCGDDSPPKASYSEIDQEDAFADTRWLYLPNEPVWSVRFGFKPGSKVLALMYKLGEGDDWIYATGEDKDLLTGDLQDQSIHWGSVAATSAETFRAVALTQKAGSKVLGLRAVVGPRPGFLPAGAMLAPGDALTSPDGRSALTFDESRRVVISEKGQEKVLWEPATTMTPNLSWRLLVGSEALHVFDASTPIQRIDPNAKAGAMVLSMQDDGNLVFYRIEGAGRDERTTPTAASQSDGIAVEVHVK